MNDYITDALEAGAFEAVDNIGTHSAAANATNNTEAETLNKPPAIGGRDAKDKL